MKKILILTVMLIAFVASAINYDTITCNVGDFTTTNVANQKVTYSGKYGSVTIVPTEGVIMQDITFTNAASYALTNAEYSIDATIPVNATLTLLGVKRPYEPINLYFLSTNGATVVDFIWHD